MEIRQLRSFVAVADTLNFSRAADSLYLSQPALTRQIQELERELGVPLIIRTTRRVELTTAGEELRHRAKDLISRMEKIPPEVKKLAGRDKSGKTLNVGMDESSMESLIRRKQLADAVYALRSAYPGLRVLFFQLEYEELLERLSDGRLDCVLILDRVTAPREEFRVQVLGEDEMVLAFRSTNPHSWGDYADAILNRGLILVERDARALYHILRILSALDLQPQLRFCGTPQDMAMTVASGESAAILPGSILSGDPDSAIQQLPLPTQEARLSYLLLSRADQDSDVIRALGTQLLSEE